MTASHLTCYCKPKISVNVVSNSKEIPWLELFVPSKWWQLLAGRVNGRANGKKIDGYCKDIHSVISRKSKAGKNELLPLTTGFGAFLDISRPFRSVPISARNSWRHRNLWQCQPPCSWRQVLILLWIPLFYFKQGNSEKERMKFQELWRK